MRSFTLVLLLIISCSFSAIAEENGGASVSALASVSDYKKGKAAYAQDNFPVAFDYFVKSSKDGNPKADFELAVMNLYSRGIKGDDKKAFHYFERAAEKGNLGGIFMLGRMYIEGIGAGQDIGKALDIYAEAADEGKPFFQYLLGRYLRGGIFVDKDPVEAVFWFEKAAKGGSALAMLNLAEMYEVGEGVELNRRKAAEYYEQASRKGVPAAMLKLGKPLKVRADTGFADDMWMLRKAGEDNEQALYDLAAVYERIKEGRSFEWSRRSAEDTFGKNPTPLIAFEDYTTGKTFRLLFLPIVSLVLLTALAVYFICYYRREEEKDKLAFASLKPAVPAGKPIKRKKKKARKGKK